MKLATRRFKRRLAVSGKQPLSALLDRQWLFARLLPRLIDKAHELGFEVSVGEVYRTPEQALRNEQAGTGIRHSLHTLSLAVDLRLFRDGKYLVASPDYKLLGDWWEQQNPVCSWGGKFGDGNHFSLEWEGRK
jgi:hypothetical protein